ncbi:MAG: hypothetical protein HQL73_02840 [Magnetococcales bacterium]|nr:hypothetical protein [Magnetococcales bacterium]
MQSFPSEYFSRAELACPCCGKCDMDPGFIVALDAVRKAYGKPMVITSGYRCFSHNASVGGVKGSAHLVGKAVDVRTTAEEAGKLIPVAKLHGITGIGHGHTFTHIDTSHAPAHGQPVEWHY